MEINGLFNKIEKTLQAKFSETSEIFHQGDKGENREEILRDFLANHLPKRFGVTKGEVVTKEGIHSYAADIIIYDAINCPILYSGRTNILPIEGVYGVIEVKSGLSKDELESDTEKIKKFKLLAPRDLSVIETREYVTVQRASRPFGIILSYNLRNNSLESLQQNWNVINQKIFNVDYFTNYIAVLGKGIIRHEKFNLTKGEKYLLIDTDEFVNLVLTAQKKARNNEKSEEIGIRVIIEELGDNTFGRFYVYLLTLLLRMKLNTPDLARYIDINADLTIIRE